MDFKKWIDHVFVICYNKDVHKRYRQQKSKWTLKLSSVNALLGSKKICKTLDISVEMCYNRVSQKPRLKP